MNLSWLEKLDRRWLFLIVALLVLGPLLRPLGLPLTTSAPVKQFHDTVAGVPDGSIILLSCDYDPGAKPELVPMTKTALRQLWDKQCKLVITCLWNGGPGLIDATIEEVANEYRAKGVPLEYGKDYVFLGYKAGNEAVMVLMGQGIANAFPRDHRGNVTRSLPLMTKVRDYSTFPLLVNISAGYPGTKEWVQQVNTRFQLPMVSGCTAVSAPEYYAYLQAGQLSGLLGGMAGAAEYEKIREEKGSATKGMDAQSLAHIFIALCIIMGNVVMWTKGGNR